MKNKILKTLAVAIPFMMVGITPVSALSTTVGVSAQTDVQTNANTQNVRMGTNTNIGARVDIRQQNLANAKKLAVNIVNTKFIKTLTDIRTRVVSNTTLSTQAKASVLAKLDAEITWFTQQSAEINAATTLAAVKSTTSAARTRFLAVAKEARKLYVTAGYVVALQQVINNLNSKVVVRLDAKINQLSAKGVDVNAQTALMATAKADIAVAQTKLTAVQNSNTVAEAKTNFQAARTALQKAKRQLKQVIESLRKLLPKAAANVSATGQAQAETR